MRPPPLLPNDSVVKIFWHRVRDLETRIAFRHKTRGLWKPLSWGRYGALTRGLCQGLAALGAGHRDRIALLGKPSPHGFAMEMATLMLGAIAVPVDPRQRHERWCHVLRDSGASLCFVDDWEQAAALQARKGELPALKKIVVAGGVGRGEDHDRVVTLRDFLVMGRQCASFGEDHFEMLVEKTRAEDIALLIYSPAESTPKGAMISHDNLVFQMMTAQTVWPFVPSDRLVVPEPVTDMAAQLLSLFYPLVFGYTVFIPETQSSVLRDLQEVEPTICAGSPEWWAGVRTSVCRRMAAAPSLHRRVFFGAESLALTRAREVMDQTPPSLLARTLAPVARGTVLARLRRHLGLGACRLAVGFGAEIHARRRHREVSVWAQALGLPWRWMLGDACTSGLSVLYAPFARKSGQRFRVLPKTRVRRAPKGRLDVRGRHVFCGVWPLLEEQAAGNGEHWLRTDLEDVMTRVM